MSDPAATASPPPDEDSPHAAAEALWVARQRLRQSRWRRALAMGRLAIWPVLIGALAVFLFQLDTGKGFGSKLFGIALLLGVAGMFLGTSAGFRARFGRSRRLGTEIRSLETESEGLRRQLLGSAASKDAQGGVSLAENEGEAGALSLATGDGGLAASEGGADLGRGARRHLFLAAARPRLGLLAAGFGLFALVMLLILAAEPDYVGVGALLFGTAILLPILVASLPALASMGLLADEARFVSVQLTWITTTVFSARFAEETGVTRPVTFSLPAGTAVPPDTPIRAAVGRSDDRELLAVEVPGVGWLAEVRIRA